jgi:hypothetical protein
VIVELSKLLETTPNHLLGTGEYDTDILEILCVLKKMSPRLKKGCFGTDKSTVFSALTNNA